jgi:hypothetical protein
MADLLPPLKPIAIKERLSILFIEKKPSGCVGWCVFGIYPNQLDKLTTGMSG